MYKHCLTTNDISSLTCSCLAVFSVYTHCLSTVISLMTLLSHVYTTNTYMVHWCISKKTSPFPFLYVVSLCCLVRYCNKIYISQKRLKFYYRIKKDCSRGLPRLHELQKFKKRLLTCFETTKHLQKSYIAFQIILGFVITYRSILTEQVSPD